MVIVEYEKNMPDEMKAEVSKVLDPMLFLIPGWLQRLRIEWCCDANDEDFQGGASMWVSVSYEYRLATLVVTPLLLEDDAKGRQCQVIHELLHVSTCILADYARDEIQRLLPEDDDPKYHGAIMAELTSRHEAMTQDLAATVQKVLAASN